MDAKVPKSTSGFLGARARRELVLNLAGLGVAVFGVAAFLVVYRRPVVFAPTVAAPAAPSVFHRPQGAPSVRRSKTAHEEPYSIERFLGAPNRGFPGFGAAPAKRSAAGRGRKGGNKGGAEEPSPPEEKGPYATAIDGMIDALNSPGESLGGSHRVSVDDVWEYPGEYAIGRPLVSLDEAILLGGATEQAAAVVAEPSSASPGAAASRPIFDLSSCFCLKGRDVGVDSGRPECGGLKAPVAESLHACDPDNTDVVLIGAKAHFAPRRASAKGAAPWKPTLELALRELYGGVGLIVASMLFLWVGGRGPRALSVGMLASAVVVLLVAAGLGAHMLLWLCYQIEDLGGAKEGRLVRIAGVLILGSAVIRALTAATDSRDPADAPEGPRAPS